MKSLFKHVLIKFEKDSALKEKINYNGTEFYVAADFNPELYANVDGVIHGECTLLDVEGEPIKHGDHIAIDYRVVAQYEWVGMSKTSAGHKVYKNRVDVDDDVFWKVSVDFVQAVKRGNRWVAVGEYCLLKPIEKPKAEVLQLDGVGAFVDANNGGVVEGKAKWVSGNIPEMQEGDIIAFEEKYRAEYEFSDAEKFVILPSMFIMAKYN